VSTSGCNAAWWSAARRAANLDCKMSERQTKAEFTTWQQRVLIFPSLPHSYAGGPPMMSCCPRWVVASRLPPPRRVKVQHRERMRRMRRKRGFAGRWELQKWPGGPADASRNEEQSSRTFPLLALIVVVKSCDREKIAYSDTSAQVRWTNQTNQIYFII
jgi:hypothetical protein